MTDSRARDVPVTSPKFEGRLGLDWLEPPSLLVLRHPVDLHLRLKNISHETLNVVRARDAAVALLSVGGDSLVAGAGGFFALGEETTMRPGDSADVPAHGHFGHDGSASGHPSAGSYLMVACLHVGIRQESGWKYVSGMVVSRPAPIKLGVFSAEGEST